MKKLLFLSFICLLIYSCSENDIDRQIDNLNEPDLEITPTIINGTLSFKTSDELISTIKFLLNLSVNERKEWEKEHGFYSIRRRVEEGFEEIEKANQKESLEDLEKALLSYKDVIAENDTEYYQIYPTVPYQFICNRIGLYILSNHVFKFNPKEIEVYNLEDLEKLNKGIQIEPIRSFKDYFNILHTDVKSTQSSILTGEYFDNPSGCKHDRRCYVELEDVNLYEYYEFTDPYGNPYYAMVGTILVVVHAWGTKRNWLCKWSSYATLLAYRNVSYTVYVYQNDVAQQFLYCDPYSVGSTSSTIVPFSGTFPDYAPSGDYGGIYDIEHIGHCIINEGTAFYAMNYSYLGFISAHAEATSRGILYYVNWAVINQ